MSGGSVRRGWIAGAAALVSLSGCDPSRSCTFEGIWHHVAVEAGPTDRVTVCVPGRTYGGVVTDDPALQVPEGSACGPTQDGRGSWNGRFGDDPVLIEVRVGAQVLTYRGKATLGPKNRACGGRERSFDLVVRDGVVTRRG